MEGKKNLQRTKGKEKKYIKKPLIIYTRQLRNE